MSSSEEDLSRLREAVDPQFSGKDALEQKCNGQTEVKNKAGSTTSSRPNYTNDPNYDDHGMTPEFRNYIAKKLSNILESKIKIRNSTLSNPETESPLGENGIRLFASSKTCIANEEESPCQKRKKPDLLKKYKNHKKRKGNSSSSSSEDEMEQLASVAVTSDWVTSKQGVYDYVKPTVEAEQGTVVTNKSIAEEGEGEQRSSGHHRNVCRKKKHRDTDDKQRRNKRKLKES